MDVTQQQRMDGPIYVQYYGIELRAAIVWRIVGAIRRLPLSQMPAQAIVMPQVGCNHAPRIWT
jgi:hypothetical protein